MKVQEKIAMFNLLLLAYDQDFNWKFSLATEPVSKCAMKIISFQEDAILPR